MQAGPADSRNRSEYNLPTTADYYKRFTNANTFISNNANPFLISPYSPNQVNGSNNQSVFYVNTIKPLTPSGTIQIQGSVNIATPYNLLLNDNQMFTDKIYSGGLLGGSVIASCDSTTSSFNVDINNLTKFQVSSSNILMNENVEIANSTLTISSLGPSTVITWADIITSNTYTNTLNMTNTAIGAAGALAGYIPITVDIGTGAPVNYKLAVYTP
uniref:Uncharacterized protein n=1 Tax=viral metagenome TaxID=1070528 RepID=A0A6C0DEV2_9ZZZZ